MRFQVGDSMVDVLVDIDRFELPIAQFLPGTEPGQAESVRPLLGPDHVDLERGMLMLAIQTYVRTIQQQQAAIAELSTPVLLVRPRLLMVPIIGVIDSQRAQQLTESLLGAIRTNRAKVVVMDITGVAAVDSKVDNHVIQTVAAARLMGADVIVTGLSADVAQSLVALGVDLSRIKSVGDLQGGLEEAERMLGYQVVPLAERATAAQRP